MRRDGLFSDHGARVFQSDRSQRRLQPISEAPHETGVSGFVDVLKDTDCRDSVRSFERVHVRVKIPYQDKRVSHEL